MKAAEVKSTVQNSDVEKILCRGVYVAFLAIILLKSLFHRFMKATLLNMKYHYAHISRVVCGH